ncbi:MAG: dihydrofolate reductase family protein [Micromonosporaceae bacterium]
MGAAIGAVSDSQGFLMGRKLYDEWSAYWPEQGDDVPFASHINNVPKYVVSSSLQTADWNNTTVISGDVAAQVRKLKESTDGSIEMSGSATTVRWLLSEGLLDELRLMVHPILVGHGQRVFEDPSTQPLRLVSQETFDTGVLNLTYVPDSQ